MRMYTLRMQESAHSISKEKILMHQVCFMSITITFYEHYSIIASFTTTCETLTTSTHRHLNPDLDVQA